MVDWTLMATFEEQYQRLNERQKQAVDAIEGPVMVLAGPGTGKTQILSVRIARILQTTQVQPHNILALSFTQAAAKNMQQRLVSLIGPAGYQVKCSTFHSFCSELIESNQELFPVSPNTQESLGEVDRLAIVEDILRDNDFEHIKSPKNPFRYVRDCLKLISEYKREGHSPLSLRQLAEAELENLENEKMPAAKRRQQESMARKNLEVVQVYAEYERQLREKNQYDFEDMILWVRDALRDNEDFSAQYQEQYQYVLVDEFQDTNQAQLQVVQALVSFWGEAANLFVVGDPNQSIYRFQGASLSNTLSFLDLYPNAQVIVLTIGYRCGQPIYDISAELISKNILELKDERLTAIFEPLKNPNRPNAKLVEHEAANTLAEVFWLAQQIQNLHEQGIAYSEIAVLYRKHSQGILLQDALNRLHIPVYVHAGSDLFSHPRVGQLIRLLRFLSDLQTKKENPEITSVLQLPWFYLDASDVLKVVRAGSTSRAHHSVWEFLKDDKALKTLELSNPEAIILLRDQFEVWQKLDSEMSVSAAVEQILRDSGFYKSSAEGEIALLDVNAVLSLLRELRQWSARYPTGRLQDWLHRLGRMQHHGIGLPLNAFDFEHDGVYLGTVHQAKGLEWKQVFLLHVNDGKWGNLRAVNGITPLPGSIPYAELGKDEKNEDERRLMYVAMTRAIDNLTVSYSQSEVAGERSKEMQPSQFLFEFNRDNFIKTEPLSSVEVVEFAQQFVQPPEEQWSKDLDRAWILSLIENSSLSVSALNEFLACPTGFLYKRLIRVPEEPAPALVIGTAVHAALETFYKDFSSTGKKPDLEVLMTRMDRALVRSELPADHQEKAAAFAKTIVSRYYHAVLEQEQQNPTLVIERFFGSNPPIFFEGLRLAGKIDRVDLVDDASRTVRVMDYKTGTVHSRNAILGQTQSSSGSLIRQLQFYKLLGDLDPTFQWKIIQGEFIFVEQTDSGKYKTERFDLNDDDLEPLKQTLREVKEKLHSLSFLSDPGCGKCHTCERLGISASPVEEQLHDLQMQLF